MAASEQGIPKLDLHAFTGTPLGQVYDIVRLEDRVNSTNGADKPKAISTIERIVGETQHRGTVMYGLRVLSKFGYDEERLLEFARSYNTKVSELDGIDPPTIPFFYTEYEVEDFKRAYL